MDIAVAIRAEALELRELGVVAIVRVRDLRFCMVHFDARGSIRITVHLCGIHLAAFAK